jgi:hypothetical protein
MSYGVSSDRLVFLAYTTGVVASVVGYTCLRS